MRRPLVLCPLAVEAAAFARFGKTRVEQIGGGAAAVERAFLRLRGENCPSFVLLFGLAGALDPSFATGAAFVIGSVHSDSLPHAPTLHAPLLNSRCLPTPPTARIIECPAPVATVSEKAALAAATNGQLVDMESYTFATCASQLGIPWAIVRAVSDSAREALPCEVLSFIDGQGNTRVLRVLSALVRRPQLLPQLLALHHASKHALREGAFLADAICCAQEVEP